MRRVWSVTLDACKTLLPFHHLKEKNGGKCVSPGLVIYQKGGPSDLVRNKERAVASSESKPWSPFKSPLSLNSGDSLLLDERKLANDK